MGKLARVKLNDSFDEENSYSRVHVHVETRTLAATSKSNSTLSIFSIENEHPITSIL
jgi:6-phosphogluconolactonase (cycloisomerase 2 family)